MFFERKLKDFFTVLWRECCCNRFGFLRSIEQLYIHETIICGIVMTIGNMWEVFSFGLFIKKRKENNRKSTKQP